jgi:RNA polymerase sigma-54 factor
MISIRTDLIQTQVQKLAMTPEMYQSIQLLHLNSMEMENLVDQELVDNPLLEIDEYTESSEEAASDVSLNEREVEEATREEIQEDQVDQVMTDPYWEEVYEENRSSGLYQRNADLDGSRDYFENSITRSEDLQTHLLWQLQMTNINGDQTSICEAIIGNIDDDGYLRIDEQELINSTGAAPEMIEKCIRLIQTFEPDGVGARNLSETLLIQLASSGNNDEKLRAMIRDHLDDLLKRRYRKISGKLGITQEKIQHYIEIISKLEPKPGREFTSAEARYIKPDVIVKKIDDEYVVMINDEDYSKLKISPFYQKLLKEKNKVSKKEWEYIRNKFRSALWLIKNIERRNRTLFKVTECIVRIQKGFFENGIEDLKPLTLKDVAAEVDLHESTVGRTTTSKYVETPRGLFELKFFFSRGVQNEDGEGISRRSIKDRIKNIVAEEDATKPMSDRQITEILNEEKIKISRRAVSKYREEMGILPTNMRRQVSNQRN